MNVLISQHCIVLSSEYVKLTAFVCIFPGDLNGLVFICLQHQTRWFLHPAWVPVWQSAGVQLQDWVPQSALETLRGSDQEKTVNLFHWQVEKPTRSDYVYLQQIQETLRHFVPTQVGVQSEEGGLGWRRLQGGGVSEGARRRGRAQSWRENPLHHGWRRPTQVLQ